MSLSTREAHTTPSLAHALREATALEHRQVEAALRLGDPYLGRASYARALVCLERFVRAWEAAVRQRSELPWGPWLPRRRWLAEDLLQLGIDATGSKPTPLHLPHPVGISELGAHYVLEGSALGAATLTRTLDRKLPAHYFSALATQAGSRWRAFQRHLEAVPPADHPAVIAGAHATFRALVTEASAERHGTG